MAGDHPELPQVFLHVIESDNTLANTVELVERVRKLGAAIVFTPTTFTDDYHEVAAHPYGILNQGRCG